MAGSDKKAGGKFDPSMESADELENWGYGFPASDDYYDLDKSLPIKSALNGLGVDSKTLAENGNNHAMQWEHEEETAHDAWGSYGARYEGAKKNPPVTVLPKLQSWSDIAWLQWADITFKGGHDVKSLKYFFQTQVENAPSQPLIARALERSG
ncbi:hypothetical protein EJ02DRAFT_417181 [Clathrospora elynae]|uniref:Uncharacterized protein n=1 Tax=Clathrospora elynae TaxID=706981 RepID=A0A6A5T672_9PLEO|nr:hypothetical protein EJ02DRAFT_417181 [Clathrospora elynae]